MAGKCMGNSSSVPHIVQSESVVCRSGRAINSCRNFLSPDEPCHHPACNAPPPQQKSHMISAASVAAVLSRNSFSNATPPFAGSTSGYGGGTAASTAGGVNAGGGGQGMALATGGSGSSSTRGSVAGSALLSGARMVGQSLPSQPSVHARTPAAGSSPAPWTASPSWSPYRAPASAPTPAMGNTTSAAAASHAAAATAVAAIVAGKEAAPSASGGNQGVRGTIQSVPSYHSGGVALAAAAGPLLVLSQVSGLSSQVRLSVWCMVFGGEQAQDCYNKQAAAAATGVAQAQKHGGVSLPFCMD